MSNSTVCNESLGRRERTDRNVISVRISEGELLGLSVRIQVWLLFKPSDERACPLKRQVEIIDTEVSGFRVPDSLSMRERSDAEVQWKPPAQEPADPTNQAQSSKSEKCRARLRSSMHLLW